MNLKLEDLSQYIVLLIFVLIIIKVLGAGFYSKIIEILGGHKKDDHFELDELISKKKSQMVHQHLSPNQTVPTDDDSLRGKVQNSSHPQKTALLELIKAIQWGEYHEDYTSKAKSLLEDISQTSGLSLILEHFFDKTFTKKTSESEDILSQWSELSEKAILWTNLLNQTKTNTSIGKISKVSSLRSLAHLKIKKESEVRTLSEEELIVLLEEFYRPLNIEKLDFSGSSFVEVKTEEIFHLWQKNAHIFKSLAPNIPTSIETTNEVLDSSLEEESADDVKDNET